MEEPVIAGLDLYFLASIECIVGRGRDNEIFLLTRRLQHTIEREQQYATDIE
jgi:hypothetical protein